MATSAVLMFAGKTVAAPAISFLVTKAFNCLNEYCSSEGMEDIKNNLFQSIPKVGALFDIVNPEYIKEQSKHLDAWVWLLRDAVEEAEDAIDEFEYFKLEEKVKDQKVSDRGSSFGKMKHKALDYIKRVSILDNCVSKITHRHTIKRLRRAVVGLDKAAAGVASFFTLADHIKGFHSSSQHHDYLMNEDRETGPMLTTTAVFGRDAEKGQLVKWLTKNISEEDEIVTGSNHLPVISVVGHGGMGKTTLAQQVCKEDRVMNHFEKVIWVYVSSSFDAKAVIRKMLESSALGGTTANTLDALQQVVEEKLKSSRFLLILDDVWEDKNIDQWGKLFAPLRAGNRGSKILLTTRMHSVAEMAANVMKGERECLTLHGLDKGDNLMLLHHHAFAGLNPQNYSELHSIGEEIAKKLRGYPLVTKVAGGYLRSNMTSQCWNKFLCEDFGYFEGNVEDVMKVLKLSYHHLPAQLQVCFRYCSIFPSGYCFRKEELVQLWICSGLILQATSGAKLMEDTGEEHLAQLTRKSFFDLKYQKNCFAEEFEYYVMHDLLHDLATSVSVGECARICDVPSSKHAKKTVRHLYIEGIGSIPVEEIKKISMMKNLRTIIISPALGLNKDIVCTIEKVIEGSKSLRLLKSGLDHTSHFPVELANLKHLRYVQLLKISSEAVCGILKLYQLIVLICVSVKTKPKHARDLRYLDHLQYIEFGKPSVYGNFPVGKHTSLQNLPDYRIQRKDGYKISALRDLRSLRELGLHDLENVDNQEEAKDANLKEKQHLKSLSLQWSKSNGTPNQTSDLVLDHLEPHANLKKLGILGHDGFRVPLWFANLSVKKLVMLSLKKCINWDHIPSLAELQLLMHLALEDLPKLRQIGQSFHDNIDLSLPPSLETLTVIGCHELRELPFLPPSLMSLYVSGVGLMNLPRISKQYSAKTGTELSQLLYISVIDCPSITSLEGSLVVQKQFMRTVTDLTIKNCTNLNCALLSFEEMDQLKKLCIQQYGDLKVSPLGSLQGLVNLTILKLVKCSFLTSFPQAEVCMSLISLKWLTMKGCEELLSLGGLGFLPSLSFLRINGCRRLMELIPSLTADSECKGDVVVPITQQIFMLNIDHPSLLLLEPLKSFHHTEALVIKDGSGMKMLPDQWLLQNRASLQTVSICNVNSLESLPSSMMELCIFRNLYLYGASQLRSLPDLPSALKQLIIEDCNEELYKRTTVYGSDEWIKISNIPEVQIGEAYFMMGKRCSLGTIIGPGSSTNKISHLAFHWCMKQAGITLKDCPSCNAYNKLNFDRLGFANVSHIKRIRGGEGITGTPSHF